MSFLLHAASFALRPIAEQVSTTVVAGALGTIDEALTKRDHEKTRELMTANPQNKKLRIKQAYETLKDELKVYDEDDVVVYTAKGNFFGPKPAVKVFDRFGNYVGCVKEQLLSSLNLPNLDIVTGERRSFAVEVHGTMIGTIRPEIAGSTLDVLTGNLAPLRKIIKGATYVFDFNDWKVEQTRKDSFRYTYSIVDGQGNLVAVVSNNIKSRGDHYIVDMFQDGKAFLCVLIALAMDILHAPEKTRRERIEEHRYRKYYDTTRDEYKNRE